ncbi:MAG: hypothetical protein E7242_01590 [Lachnospiraceae bacterium]|nr:hypothetical protein [Lachnospiraceae bacterium]
MNGKKSVYICLSILYIVGWACILTLNIVENCREFLYFSVFDELQGYFIFLVFLVLIAPLIITIWLFCTINSKDKRIVLKIVSCVLSLVVSFLVTIIGLFMGYGQSETFDLENYGKVDERVQECWDEAKKFFPDEPADLHTDNVSYKYKYSDPIGNRSLLIELNASYSNKEDYNDMINYLEKNESLERAGDAFIYKITAYDTKGYVATDDFNSIIEFHYEYGKME